MRFSLGQLVATRGVARLMDETPDFRAFVNRSLSRYQDCDWGEMPDDDKRLNDFAVQNSNDRIFAAYTNAQHPDWKIWIITEADRSSTTILFPHDY